VRPRHARRRSPRPQGLLGPRDPARPTDPLGSARRRRGTLASPARDSGTGRPSPRRPHRAGSSPGGALLVDAGSTRPGLGRTIQSSRRRTIRRGIPRR
jgi:hypothetical protein